MDLDPENAPAPRRRRTFLETAPSWWFLAALFAIVVVVGLAARFSRAFYVNVVWKYYWGPIAADMLGRTQIVLDGVEARGGYNLVNTASWAVLLGLLLLWAYRLLAELRERMNTELVVAIVPYLLWGSVYHVLEDSDLFAPFGATPTGPTFFDQYLGALFITPIIWLEVVFVVVAVLWIGHRAQRVADGRGLARGLQFVGYFLVGLTALYVALWLAEPRFIRYVASPLVALGATVLAYLIIWFDARKVGTVNPRTFVFATGLWFLFIGLFYVIVWQIDASEAWGIHLKGAGTEPKWWVLATLILGIALFTAFMYLLARALTGPARESSKEKPTRHFVLLVVVALFAGLWLLYGALGACRLGDPADPNTPDGAPACFDPPLGPGNDLWAWLQLASVPAMFWILLFGVGRWARGGLGARPELAPFMHPVNLLMVAGQMTDAFMTSVGVDFFAYKEKHVLPRALIELVAQLPEPFGSFATTLVMIPLKVFIVLAVVWLIDVSAKEESTPARDNLMGLVKLAILMVGLSPGVRNAFRVAMAT